MRTEHRVVVGDSRTLDGVDDGSVDLVVTSPPYPMIEMWDDAFAALDSAVADCLDAGDADAAFDRMHGVLAETWAEVRRALAPGGIACVVVGDATRTVDGTFARYPNSARVTDWFTSNGFTALPEVLWRKPTNSAAKFMGSGMLPPNAYVTLEHEHVLVFRKGEGRRSFDPGADRRYEAAYFWEERNEWFSDVWTDLTGTLQAIDADDPDLRERSAAFPFAVPYRLVCMFSAYGDTVLDPFWGTGTTSLAAMVAARDSVGVEREAAFADVFADRVTDLPDRSRAVARERLERHAAFVADHDGSLDYESAWYDLPVMTKQERRLRLYEATDVTRDGDAYRVTHDPFEWTPRD